MPTYRYNCAICGQQDIVQSIHDEALTECPQCHILDFKKVYGKVGIQFKGSGFYSTDTRGK